MTHAHMTPSRRAGEIIMSLYGFWWGAGILSDLSAGLAPLYWTPLPHDGRGFALSLMVAAFVHAIGIRVNGRWSGSPVLRAVAMIWGAICFGELAWWGMGTSAARTYSFISALYAAGVASALIDVALGYVLRRA